MAKFENYNTGKSSKAHKHHLKKEIKKKLKGMSFTEFDNHADIIIFQYEKNPSEKLLVELNIIRDLFKNKKWSEGKN